MNSQFISEIDSTHIPAIFEIEKVCFAEPWLPTSLSAHIGSMHSLNCCVQVASTACANQAARESCDNEGIPLIPELVAYALTTVAAEEMDLLRIAVLPAYRRQGLGRQLLTHLFRKGESKGVSRSFLDVRESNLAARALYESLGFTFQYRRAAYYHNPKEDSLVYLLPKFPAQNAPD